MPELIVTLFEAKIQKHLFPDNAFYKRSTLDHGGVDVEAKTVKIPEESAVPTVVKNPSSFPLAVAEMDDDQNEYDVELYATLPTRVRDETQAIVSYNKLESILSRHINTLNTEVADDFAIKFTSTTAAQIVETTGDLSGALPPIGTGSRRKVAKNDFIKMKEIFNKDDIPQSNRLVLIPSEFLTDILEIPEFVDADKIDMGKLTEGAIGRLLGFDVMMRSRTAIYANETTPKSLGAAGAIGDRHSALFWHPNFVRRSEGQVKVYRDLNNPIHLGSVWNAAVRAGGRKSYTDGRGVGALVQATS